MASRHYRLTSLMIFLLTASLVTPCVLANDIAQENSQGLVSQLSDATGDIPLQELHLTSWVFPQGCVAGLQTLKDALSNSDSRRTEVVAIITNALDRQTIQHILDKGRAFELLLQRGDGGAIWEVLRTRSQRSASFVDLLILGELFWGGRFSCRLNDPASVISLNDEPLPPSEWATSLGAPFPWGALYRGTNNAYRLLAVEAFTLWDDQSDIEEFLRKGWEQDNHAIVRTWARRIQKLPAKKREEIAATALENAKQIDDSLSLVPGWKQQVVDQLSRLLNEARADKAKALRMEKMKQSE